MRLGFFAVILVLIFELVLSIFILSIVVYVVLTLFTGRGLDELVIGRRCINVDGLESTSSP